MKLFERFWSKTSKQGQCLVWTAAITCGYGSFRAKQGGRWKQVRASRWIYEQVVGPIPEGYVIMHSCDNRACVALQHLMPAPQMLNIQDCINKGRFAYADRMPHSKLTQQQVREIKRLRAEENLSQQKLADRFGVSRELVREILRGRRWKHVG